MAPALSKPSAIKLTERDRGVVVGADVVGEHVTGDTVTGDAVVGGPPTGETVDVGLDVTGTWVVGAVEGAVVGEVVLGFDVTGPRVVGTVVKGDCVGDTV